MIDSWNGSDTTDLRVRLEMFSSYAVSSAAADDGLDEVGFRKLANDDVFVDVTQVDTIFDYVQLLLL